jgi:hypothetical protein
MSQPLDLERPLWQLYLIEGLEGGRHAYISKTHHALVDGVSAVDVGTIMLDPNPEGTEIPIGEERWDPDEPSPELLLVRAASDGIRAPLRAAGKAARSALTMPRGTASAVMRTAEGFANLAARGPSAPHTFFNQEIGGDRRVGFVRAELAALIRSLADDWGIAVLLIEHDMTFVRQIAKDRRVTVLHQGAMLCEGPVEQVQNDPRVLEVYLGQRKDTHAVR